MKELFLVLLVFASLVTIDSVSPTCAIDYPCAPPTWGANWSLNLSTICQPAENGYFLPPLDQPWGMISLDWSNAISIWLKNDRMKSTCEATNIHNALLIKQVSPGTRVFIYHNMELALQWLESQRPVMYDPTKAHYFLQYTDGNGKKNGTIYNEPISQGDQYFWDFRVPEAADAFVKSVISSLSPSWVDGTFTDDVTGFPAEHGSAPARIRMSQQEVIDLQIATQKTSQVLIDELIKIGKYNWQAFSAGDGVGPAPSQGNCASFMRNYCQPKMQNNPMTMQFSTQYPNQILAAFLITRPPYAWLGYGWESDMRQWDPIFQTDVGAPLGLCKEGPSGVFTREWSKGKVTLDCNNWSGHINKF